MIETRPSSLLAVKSKLGELDAVLNTHLTGDAVDVIIELLGSTKIGGSVASKIIQAGAQSVRAGRPIWLDTTWLQESSPLGRLPNGALEHFEERIEEKLEKEIFSTADVPTLIPIVAATADDRELGRARMLLEHKPRSIAVRSRRTSRQGTRLLVDQLERIASVLQISNQDVHLVVDEGFVEHVHERRVGELVDAVHAIGEHHELASVSVLSGSTPPKRVNYETHVRERPEVHLWRAVNDCCHRALRYGDYGVVHPQPPANTDGYGWPNPYLHYTIPDGTLSIARRIPGRGRGAPPAGTAKRYFLEVADELVRHPEFAGSDFSWGDRYIHNCRTSPKPAVGTSTKWISMATSHHLAHLSLRRDAPT